MIQPHSYTNSLLSYANAPQTLLDRGVWVAGGSDAPIETCSPLVGMFDAIYRQERVSSVTDENDGSEQQPEVFRPEERLSFAEALWIYTTGAAYAAGCEGFLGSLVVGYAADFVVLDAGILEDPSLLMGSEPEMVVVGGNISYQREVTVRADAASGEGGDNVDTDSVQICTVIMGGPYIPGKNGKIPASKSRTRSDHSKATSPPSFPPSCACRLLGKYCVATYR